MGPGCWQKYVHLLFATNASLTSAPAIVSEINYAIILIKFRNILPAVLCWFCCVHFETCNTYHPKNPCKGCSSNITIDLYSWTMKHQCFIFISTYIKTLFCIAKIRDFTFLCNIIMPHLDFQVTTIYYLQKTYGRNQWKYIILHID